MHAAEMAVAAATEAATAATAQAAEAAAALPPLREIEADARTVLERHRVAQEQIAGEEQARPGRAWPRRSGASRQLRQDLAHAEQLQRDAAAADQRLAAEEAALGGGRRRA